MLKKYLLLIISFILIFHITENQTSANGRAYNYPYVCKDNSCDSTKFDKIRPNSNGYYLSDVSLFNGNGGLYNIIKNVVEVDLSNYYNNKTFVIEGFHTNGEVSNKSFTIKQIFNYSSNFDIANVTINEICEENNEGEEECEENQEIQIQKSYNNGYEYLLINFSNIINTLHSGLPIGDKKNQISDYIPNIKGGLNYSIIQDTYYYKIRNTCIKNNYSSTDNCDETDITNRSINSTNPFKYINGIKRSNSEFIVNNFKVSDDYFISANSIKAGEAVRFEFGFDDYLDVDSNKTDYEYRIFYNYLGENEPELDDFLLKEKISIDINGNLSSENIEDEILGDIFDLQINNRTKKIRLGIKEGINFTKAGNVYFYLYVKNLNTGDLFDITKINSIPLRIFPSDDIKNGTYESTITPFNGELNKTGFSHETTFSVNVRLKDSFGNNHFDYITGYDISLSTGSSEDILLAKFGDPTYYKSISGVKSDEDAPYNISFRVKIPKSGYHSIKGFNIRARYKSDFNNYSTPAKYSILENVIPTNLYIGNQLEKIFIKPNTDTDFVIDKCTSGSITFKAVCNSDNFSGCNNYPGVLNVGGNIIRNQVTFNKQAQNGAIGTLVAIDKAYNQTGFNYFMDHIDQSAPEVTVLKGGNIITDNSYSFKANSDNFEIDFYEYTPSGITKGGQTCRAETNYLIRINGVNFKIGKLQGASNKLVFNKFFEKSGDYLIEIVATDYYGNSKTKNINFKIFPDTISNSESFLTLMDTEKKYANSTSYYNYKLTLKDKYGNFIYGKKINNLEQNIENFTGGKTIFYDNISKSGGKSLETYDFGSESNNNGEIFFKLKSLTPGEFSQRFKFNINNWGENYINNSTLIHLNVLNIQNNIFKNPVEISDISLSNNIINNNGPWTDNPEMSKNQKYKIELKNAGNIAGFSNGQVDINSNSIINATVGHFWGDFKNITTNFGNNINSYLGFIGRVDGNSNLLSGISVKNEQLKISYNLSGRYISYILDEYNLEPICNVSTLGVKIEGIIQGGGNSSVTGQQENISDLYKTEMRSSITKNAYELTRGLKSGDIVNGVKYQEGNITISGNNLGYETLIVKNGNIIISGDLNTLNNKLGIIVLKDNYNVNTDYNNLGNIYVNNNVEYISAIIYSDGAFRSANSNGVNYADNQLSANKLELFGSLFSRNTIGGAVGASGDYILPGGSKTNNFDLASIYDLNFIRKVNLCSIEDYSFLIKYNSSIQSNPPKGFSN